MAKEYFTHSWKLPDAQLNKAFALSRNATNNALKGVVAKVKSDFSFLEKLFARDDFSLINNVANFFQERFRNILIIGTGGSALGGKVFSSWMQSSTRIHDSAFPNVIYLDNLDPKTFWHTVSACHPNDTGVLVISQSGETAEILIQLMRLIEYWLASVTADGLRERIIVITNTGDNSLHTISQQFKLLVIPYPDIISGRFTAFSIIGMIPAAIVGLNVSKIRDAAAYFCSQVIKGQLSSPLDGAAIVWTILQERKINLHVLMPYSDSLTALTLWYRQLLAESLGKNGKGFIPITAQGPIDQHSQLQLYIDGPQQKLFTFLVIESTAREKITPQLWSAISSVEHLAHSTIEDLMLAEYQATEQVLSKKFPIRTFHLPLLNEQAIGSLMMHFFLEILLLAELMKVDPCTQPAVEEGKKITREILLKNLKNLKSSK